MIIICHRYPLNVASYTNPAIGLIIKNIENSGNKVHFVCLPNFVLKVLNKVSHLIIWPIYANLKIASILTKNNKCRLIYYDDSLPGASYLTKYIYKDVKVLQRIGDMFYGYLGLGKLWTKVFEVLTIKLYSKCDEVITISELMRRYVRSKWKLSAFVTMVPEVLPADFIDLRPLKSGVPMNRCIHHGSFNKNRGIEKLIQLANKYVDIDVSIGGAGNNNIVRKIVGSRVKYLGWINRENLPDIVQQYQIGIVLRSENVGNRFVLTTAALQYIAALKCVVIPNNYLSKSLYRAGLSNIFFYDIKKINSLYFAIKAAIASEDVTICQARLRFLNNHSVDYVSNCICARILESSRT